MKYLCLILAVLLLLCLTTMPYGYYTLVRFIAMVVFAVIAYQYLGKEEPAMAVTFAALALLFQPFFKLALGRIMWNVVDAATAIFLIALVIIDRKK